MDKYSFLDDYSEGCHAQILEALAQSNLVQQTAYGEDEYSIEARKLLQGLMGCNAAVYFVGGGTLANLIAISSCLRPHEAVIAAHSGHITLRETGAIEATGHKIISVPSADGKITPADVQNALHGNAHAPHMAKPRLVYISNASELGTVYNKAELTALSVLCKANDLLLFLDGARLGAALSAATNDLSLADVAALTDMFWIGGTKAGALLGEAIVIPNAELDKDFSYLIKQRGALLAKGRVLGIQFRELFKSGLFFESAKYANHMAIKLSSGITGAGHALAAETETNQIFALLPNALIETLQQKFDFYVWGKHDESHSVIRLVTSWATDEKQVDEFLRVISD